MIFSESYLSIQKKSDGVNFPGFTSIAYYNLAKFYWNQAIRSWDMTLQKQ